MPRRVIAVMLAAALLPVLAGCGESGQMSLSEYRKSISELHDEVAWDLGEALERMKDLSFDDYYDLPELQEVFVETEGIFAAAWEAADPMYPPQDAVPLHLDLLDFYTGGEEGMREMEDTVGMFEAVLPMLRDVENLALPDLPGDAGVTEVKAAVMEDRKTMQGYLDELGGMRPPQGLQPYRDKLVDVFRSIDEAAAAVDLAVKPEDLSSFTQFRQWFATTLEGSRALWSEAMSFLGGMSRRIDAYIEQGKELAERIQNL